MVAQSKPNTPDPAQPQMTKFNFKEFLRSQEFLISTLFTFLGLVLYLIFGFETYLTRSHRYWVGWGLVVALILAARLRFVKLPPWRIIFMLTAGFLTLRYFFWRTSQTLQYTGPLDFLGMMVLYLAEAYAITIHFMGMFINASPYDSKIIPLPEDTSAYPTVDVLIPTYTEPEDIVRITAVAAKQLDYPADKLRIYICDDGSTVDRRNNPQTSDAAWKRHYLLRKIADRVGVGYITREHNDFAKAGNINHALTKTSGDLLLMLDCDHVPTRDFLKNTVGSFMADTELFLTQTPHFFINPTPIEKNVPTIPNLSAENDMFFRISHPGFNAWDSSYFCGSAALLRRKHLMEVGGVSGLTITEDAETSLALHSRGYHSVYINRPMVCGLSPESFNDYLTQRTRWAQGMIQLFILSNPLSIKGLTIPQRICYFNSCFYWFFGLPRLVYFMAPAMFLLLNLKVYHASMDQIVIYAFPHLVSTFLVMNLLYGKTRKAFFSEIYETVQAIFLLPAIFSVIVNPRKPTFKVTRKGGTTAAESLSPLARPFTAVIVLNIVALMVAVYKWVHFPLYRDVILITTSWCIYNSYLVILSLGTFWEKKQVRNYHRINVPGKINVEFPRVNQIRPADLRDISLTGVGFELDLPFTPVDQEDVILHVDDSYGRHYTFEGKVPRARKLGGGGYLMGATIPITYEDYANLVSFVYGDSQRWVDVWEAKAQPGNTLLVLTTYFKLGLKALAENILILSKEGLVVVWSCLNTAFNLFRRRIVGGEPRPPLATESDPATTMK